MVLDNSFQKVVTVAPDALVFIDGSDTIKICDKCGSEINFSDNIQDITIENSINLGEKIQPGSATLTIRVPQHSHKVFFREGRPIFTPMQEIAIWMKGYFPRYSNKNEPAGALKSILGFKNFEFYRVFWGVITEVTPVVSPENQTIEIRAKDMLYWLDRAKGNTPGIYFGRDDGVFQPTFRNVAVPDLSNLNPFFAIIWILLRFFPGNPIAKNYEDIIDDKLSYTQIQLSDEIPEEERIGATMLEFWGKRFNDISADFKIFGLSKGAVDQAVSDINARIRRTNQSVNKAQQDITKRQDSFVQTLVGFNPKLDFSFSGNAQLFNNDILNSVYDEWFNENIIRSQLRVNCFFDNYKPLSRENSSLDIIGHLRSLIGFEFYQDMNGQIILKPPFYNVNVRNNRLQVVRSWETLSEDIKFDQNELVSFVEVTGSNRDTFLNDQKTWSGSVSNPRYLKEFGYREKRDQDENLRNNDICQRQAAFKMDEQNALATKGSITILGRPEILLGYPIYYEPHDAFYYIRGIKHTLRFGNEFTTTLELAAGRKRLKKSVEQLKGPDKLNNRRNNSELLTRGGDDDPLLTNRFYLFIPNQDEADPTVKQASVLPNANLTTSEKKTLITLQTAEKIETLIRSSSFMPEGFGYWRLKDLGLPASLPVVNSKDDPGGKSRNYLSFFRAKLTTDYMEERKLQKPLLSIDDWHFPVSDRFGFEHFGLFSYGGTLELDNKGVLTLIDRADMLIEDVKRKVVEVIKTTLGAGSNVGNIWGVGLDNVDVIEDNRNPSYNDPRYTEGKDSGLLQKIKQKAAQLKDNFIGPIQDVFCGCLVNNPRFKL